MDSQLKKGLLEACVLTCLLCGESYGYKIVSDLKNYIEVTESTLYPVLKRLESTSCLVTCSREHNGRLRKYYSITREGQRKRLEFIGDMKELRIILNFIEGEYR